MKKWKRFQYKTTAGSALNGHLMEGITYEMRIKFCRFLDFFRLNDELNLTGFGLLDITSKVDSAA